MKCTSRILSIITVFFLLSCTNSSKNNIEVVDFDELYSKIDLSVDKTYVINFWATWCAPCVKELPYFEEVNKKYKDKNTEVILVSLDFPSQIKSKLKPYLKKNNIKSKVILLDDSKMNTWVPKVSEQWDGGIPATLIVNPTNYNFYPKPFKKEELYFEINKAIK
jgi:thiol-disulfide isomerase/thioredoxin